MSHRIPEKSTFIRVITRFRVSLFEMLAVVSFVAAILAVNNRVTQTSEKPSQMFLRHQGWGRTLKTEARCGWPLTYVVMTRIIIEDPSTVRISHGFPSEFHDQKINWGNLLLNNSLVLFVFWCIWYMRRKVGSSLDDHT